MQFQAAPFRPTFSYHNFMGDSWSSSAVPSFLALINPVHLAFIMNYPAAAGTFLIFCPCNYYKTGGQFVWEQKMAVISALICQLLVKARRTHTRTDVQLLQQRMTDHFGSWPSYFLFFYFSFDVCFPSLQGVA